MHNFFSALPIYSAEGVTAGNWFDITAVLG